MLRRTALNLVVACLTSSLACAPNDGTTVPGDGSNDGSGDGPADGWGDSPGDGQSDGSSDGTPDGTPDGSSDGTPDGSSDGTPDGGNDGSSDGGNDGSSDGGNDGGNDGSGDGSDGSVIPGPDDPADGPGASALLTGVWNEDYQFNMADHPLSWAIAVVHASMLYRDTGINYSPNAVLSIAIKESRLSCLNPNPQNAQETMAVKDGCFQIEAESAYISLTELFPERFPKNAHVELIAARHFETSALATVYYALLSLARFRAYRAVPGDPEQFFDEHPDHQAAQKVMCGAYNRGLWWTSLANIFSDCRERDVLECFGSTEFDLTAYDHAKAIAGYTSSLDAVQPFDTQVTLDQLKTYWQSIKALYPEVSDATAEGALTAAFNAYSGGGASVSFNARIRQILAQLIAVLPATPSHDEVARRLCALGQLPCNLAP